MTKLSEKITAAADAVNAVAETVTTVQEIAKVVKAAFNFKRTKVVTVPLLKLAIDVPSYVRAEAAIYEGKQVDDKMGKAHLLNVTNLETGESQLLIIPTVLLALLGEEYPENSYIGKCFEVTKHAKVSGKNYHPFSLSEIEVA